MSLAKQLYNVKTDFIKMYDSIPVNILTEYFSKQKNLDKIFEQAKRLEGCAYAQNFISVNQIEPDLKGKCFYLLRLSRNYKN